MTRYSSDIARYTMLRHVRQEENLARYEGISIYMNTINYS